MPNRYDRNPYPRSRANGRQTGRYTPEARYSGRRVRFHWNAVNLALLGAVLVIGVVIGIMVLSKDRTPAGAGGAPGSTPSADTMQTDQPSSTDAVIQPSASATSGSEDTGAPETVATASAAPEETATPGDASASSQYFTADGSVQADDTTYKSGDLYVNITNVNENGVNYYVADCRMKTSDKLFTALATDQYAVHKEELSSTMAKRKGAVVAINGDYFGSADSGSSDATHRNDKGVVIRNGKLYRSEPWYDIAAIYKDGTMKTFDKSEVTADRLMADGAVQAFNFGPMLLDGNGKAIPAEQLKKRPPLYNPANPRSGIGYVEPNHFVLVVADGRGAGGSRGLTQTEFSKLFESLGCKSAYNLDGGGSATMVFMGKVINHPCDAGGERSVSDIVYFGESETDQANIARMNG